MSKNPKKAAEPKKTGKMPIPKNWYEQMPQEFKAPTQHYENEDFVNIKLPMRLSLVGASGSGKSNCLLSLVEGINAWAKIYLFIKTDEPLYKYFESVIAKAEKKTKTKILHIEHNIDNLPPIDSFDEKVPSLCVFDDMITEKTKTLKSIEQYFILIRKRGVSLVFISQKFTSIPKVIRSNCPLIILKKISTNRDLSHIMSEFATSKSVKQLKKMYEWVNKQGMMHWFLIDTDTNDDRLKYRIDYTGIPDEIGGPDDA